MKKLLVLITLFTSITTLADYRSPISEDYWNKLQNDITEELTRLCGGVENQCAENLAQELEVGYCGNDCLSGFSASPTDCGNDYSNQRVCELEDIDTASSLTKAVEILKNRD